MRGILSATFLAIFLSFFSSVFSSPAHAQVSCGGVIGLSGINTLSGVPFQAEIQQSFFSHDASSGEARRVSTQQVARDGQGRVRVVRAVGIYKLEAGAGEGTEQERQIITICDPVKGQWVTFDTISKTATVQGKSASPGGLRPAAGAASLGGFCSQQLERVSRLHNVQVEDLGQRSIEGMDARGIRQKRSMPMVTSSAETAQVMVTEIWCSDELGAIVIRSNGTEAKGTTMTTALTNIQRGEPDPTLFQIPPDYRIVERVNGPAVRQGLVAVDGFGPEVPVEPPSTSAKP